MKSFNAIICIFIAIGTLNSYAQQMSIPEPIDCYTSEYQGTSTIYNSLNQSQLRQQPGSEIDVVYIDFPEDAKAAFQRAVEIWENYIVSTVPIKIKATWSGDLSNLTLARSSATRIISNFNNVPYKDVWYVIPLAESLAGTDLNEGDFDITIALNRRINWFVANEGTPRSDSYDLSSIALHEIAHGLGFSSSFKTTNNNEGTWGQSGLAYIYDLFIETSTELKLVNPGAIGNPSNELLQYMVGNDLYFDIFDPELRIELPKLQSFAPFELGKSISHLDENRYTNGNENSLMTPNIGPGELIREPGIRSLSILEQIGWTIKNISSSRPLATENTDFKVRLFPNPSTDKVKLYLPTSWQGERLQLAVLNAQGRQVSNSDNVIKNTNIELEVKHLPAGLYHLKGIVGQEMFSKKFIKL